jgi:DNA-binding protein YbaB
MAKGFKGPKGMGGQNPMNMMGQLQKLQEQLQEAQARLAEEIIKDGDVEMIQDLVLTAFNSALDKSRQLASDRLGPLAGGLPF